MASVCKIELRFFSFHVTQFMNIDLYFCSSHSLFNEYDKKNFAIVSGALKIMKIDTIIRCIEQ